MFQFITLAGFHALNHSMFTLANGYASSGMSAYVELQEAEIASEKDGYTATRHQREVGTGYLRPCRHSDLPAERHPRARRLDRDRAVHTRRSTLMTITPTLTRPHLTLTGPAVPGTDEVLTDEALDFLTDLHAHFSGRRHDLLLGRQNRRTRFSNGADPDFLPLTAHIRADRSWRVAGPGPGLEDRRVEITGPTDRKMTVNALNSGAKVWLADLEDATSPTWTNIVGGQHSAVRRHPRPGRLHVPRGQGVPGRLRDADHRRCVRGAGT